MGKGYKKNTNSANPRARPKRPAYQYSNSNSNSKAKQSKAKQSTRIASNRTILRKIKYGVNATFKILAGEGPSRPPPATRLLYPRTTNTGNSTQLDSKKGLVSSHAL